MATKNDAQSIPAHLNKYVVSQNYERYTPEDQAVWRYIMRQLKDFLSVHAHECYVEGLTKTGISIERIPKITEMDKKLQDFGWRAAPVSGFIPPAAFMEFQSRGILPIASDMRTLEHLLYTPAPDIVHEAAGHAPILINERFAAYLRKYADVASHAIISKEDMDQYEAIRQLSDIKEDPSSTTKDIQAAEANLEQVNSSMKYISEAAWLSRMNWWTAEYGLIGDLNSPKIFGAGLLSSVGESKECLTDKVKKIPLDVHCVDYGYDITEPQPQLFVTPDFETLHKVLDDLAERMAYRRGGIYGLNRALEAQTVNTVELNSGLQISGLLSDFLTEESNENKVPTYLKFSGPCQLAVDRSELLSHGTTYHAQGYSTPIGFLQGHDKCLSEFSDQELAEIGIKKNEKARLKFASGLTVEGQVTGWLRHKERLILISFEQCKVTDSQEGLLFDPSWGTFDMGVGSQIPSVFGGPADRVAYGETEDFVVSRVPEKQYSERQLQLHRLYQKIREIREGGSAHPEELSELKQEYLQSHPSKWLIGLELLELAERWNLSDLKDAMLTHLQSLKDTHAKIKGPIEDGIRLADKEL